MRTFYQNLWLALIWSGFSCFLLHAQSDKWELPPITGDKSKGWDAVENNWAWERGNPLTVDGATWSVEMQTSPEPYYTSDYQLMVQGTLYNFISAWVDTEGGFDPAQSYKDRTLTTKSSPLGSTFPENSKASIIVFKPSKPGSYHVAIEGKATVQNKTAGYASVCLYVLKAKRTSGNAIDNAMLNQSGGFGHYSDTLKMDHDVTLEDGDELAFRIQTVSPGQAPAGSSSIAFSTFTISKVEK